MEQTIIKGSQNKNINDMLDEITKQMEKIQHETQRIKNENRRNHLYMLNQIQDIMEAVIGLQELSTRE